MKKINFILLLLLPVLCLAENRQSKVDSLRLVLSHAHVDTNNVLARIELSTQLYEMDSYNEAMDEALEAKVMSIKLNFKSGLASSHRRIGAIYTELGKYPQAIESLLNAMRIYESLKNDYGIFMVNNNLGTAYYFQLDYNKALEYYFKSYKYKSTDAHTCSNIGMAYIGKSDFTLALHFLKKAFTYYQYDFDNNGMSSMLNNIGAIYEGQNKNDSALFYYFKALTIKQELQDNQGICDELGGIGDIYFKQAKYNLALKYELQSLALAKSIGYLSSIKETEQVLSDIYLKMNDGIKALEHYKNFTTAKDSMFNEENTKRTVSAEKDFEFQKKEEHAQMEQAKKDAVQAEQLKSQKVVKNAFIAGFLLVALFLIILFRGNKILKKANTIIAEQKKLVEHKNKEVTDNINYAQRIQKAILPSDDYMKLFPENAIIWKPKDIVSGDFYWAYTDGINKYFATADCTGHGVSGAMLTMIGSNLLNEIVIERKITRPDLVLNTLRDEIIKSLNQEGASEERKDGMDISFCKVSEMTLECACANNPIYIVRNSQVIEIKANRFPVGKYIGEEKFTLNTVELKKDDVIYTLSDGFCDQFGGEKGKKLMTKRFKEWTTEIPQFDMSRVKEELENRFSNWIGEGEQIDDVTVMIIKI